jgi:hypothetical protein
MAGVQRVMTGRNTPGARGKTTTPRDDRLKAALKANMARRKAQTRARKAPETGKPDEHKDQN